MSQPDKGCSNPYLRVKWDSMEQRCPRVMETLRPIFNFNFYFPVRSVYMDRLKRKKPANVVTELWKSELMCKGPLRIEVWDDDIASSEFLGRVIVDIADIMASKTKADRDMLGEVKSEKKGEDDDDDDNPPPEVGKQWYQQPVKSRIFDAKTQGVPLQGSSLPGTTGTPIMMFEAYFYEDISQVKELAELGEEGKTEDDFWNQKAKRFDFHNRYFQQEKYMIPFPNAVGAKDSQPKNKLNPVGEQLRRFTNMVTDPDGDGPDDLVPLMRFLTKIIVPESLSDPMDKMHWIHCLSWEPTSTKQLKQGLIPADGWHAPSFILQTRKGAAQDHAVVLCSLLWGQGMDAYVCKGTVHAMMPAAEGHAAQMQLVEHCWVMTREEGWVTFWEPMNGKLYHLPHRYTPKTKDASVVEVKKKKKKKEEDETADLEDEEQERPPELMWEGEAPDSKIEQEDVDALPTTRRQPKAKTKVGAGRRQEIDVSQQKKDQIIRDRENLPIAPCKDLLIKESTLVNYLPYDSIDTVFNARNIYANRQNHHPALIKYDFPEEDDDFDEEELWYRYLRPQDYDEMNKLSIEIDVLGDQNVSLSRPLDSDKATDLRGSIVRELEENLRLYRSKLGFDCIIDKNDYVMRELENFLNMQELVSSLDPDAIGPKPGLSEVEFKDIENKDYMKKTFHRRIHTCNKQGSVYMESSAPRYQQYRARLKQKFADLEKMIDDFRDKKDDFPVRKNKEFGGLTVHFSTSDVEDMRTYLMQLDRYKELINVKHDDIVYAIQCIVKPLAGGVQSVWVFVGAQRKIEPKKEEVKE